jgi:hypothetical protein
VPRSPQRWPRRVSSAVFPRGHRQEIRRPRGRRHDVGRGQGDEDRCRPLGGTLHHSRGAAGFAASLSYFFPGRARARAWYDRARAGTRRQKG